MNKTRTTILLLLLLVTYGAGAQIYFTDLSPRLVQGNVLLNGDKIKAEFVVLDDNTVSLGSGRNACISQFSNGHLVVPEKIDVDLQNYLSLWGVINIPLGTEHKVFKVTKVSPLAFRLCTKLRIVSLPEGVTNIGNFAFVGCSGLYELKLPSTLESVGSGAFIGLDKLHYVSCAAVTPPKWEYNDVCFFHKNGISDTHVSRYPADTKLAVPEGSEEAYRTSRFSKSDIGWNTAEGWGTAFQTVSGGIYERFGVYTTDDITLLHDLTKKGSSDINQVYFEADIDMNEVPFLPIGETSDHPFKGTVHGQGHTVSCVKSESSGVSGFFGYYSGPAIAGLRLKDCVFEGETAGGIAAVVTTDCRIDSVKATHVNVHSNNYAGGIVGQANRHLTMDRCAVDDCYIGSRQADAKPVVAGLIAKAADAAVTNSVTIAYTYPDNTLAPFVAEGRATVDYSYSTCNNTFHTNNPAAKNITLSHVILGGQPASFLDYSGKKHNFNYEPEFFKDVYPAAVLGFNAWGYAKGRFPMPDCLTDDWTPQVNMVTYGSAGMAASRVNTLVPDGNIPASAWLDQSEQGFRHFSFKTSRLWIDKKLNVQYNYDHVPLGFAERIIATDGIRLDEILKAEDKGMRDIKEPVYQINDDNTFVTDANGNYICIDTLYFGQEQIWEPKGYAVSLPYNVALPGNCTLYQPTSIYDVNGETTIMMERVRENFVEAFRPYYLVVHRDSVILGTEAEAVSPKLSSNVSQFGDYEFAATMSRIGIDEGRREMLYFPLDASHWVIASQAGGRAVEPFTSYFRPLTNKPAARLTMTFSDSDPVISVGDYYFTINTSAAADVTATLSGYHGRGGNTVVPPTIPYVTNGIEQQIPVTKVAPAAFTKSTAQVWSIDFSQCGQLEPVTVNRTAQDNPFYKVDERTIIYLPATAVTDGTPLAKNVVAGTRCASLLITDGWDFRPPYKFHADEAVYDRIFYASKQKDGSYKSVAYTVCLPFSVSDEDMGYTPHILINGMQYINMSKGAKSFVFTSHPGFTGGPNPVAAYPYMLLIREGQFQFKAHDTEVVTTNELQQQEEDFSPVPTVDFYDSGVTAGTWQGTFTRINNEEAALLNAYALDTSGKWYRIRNDEGRYRNSWIAPFRAFFVPGDTPLPYNTYRSDYIEEPQGDDEDEDENSDMKTIYSEFPADEYFSETDFSNYEDDATGIFSPTPDYDGQAANGKWYTLDGRCVGESVDGDPQSPLPPLLPKGIYLHNGKKVVIK